MRLDVGGEHLHSQDHAVARPVGQAVEQGQLEAVGDLVQVRLTDKDHLGGAQLIEEALKSALPSSLDPEDPDKLLEAWGPGRSPGGGGRVNARPGLAGGDGQQDDEHPPPQPPPPQIPCWTIHVAWIL